MFQITWELGILTIFLSSCCLQTERVENYQSTKRQQYKINLLSSSTVQSIQLLNWCTKCICLEPCNFNGKLNQKGNTFFLRTLNFPCHSKQIKSQTHLLTPVLSSVLRSDISIKEWLFFSTVIESLCFCYTLTINLSFSEEIIPILIIFVS